MANLILIDCYNKYEMKCLKKGSVNMSIQAINNNVHFKSDEQNRSSKSLASPLIGGAVIGIPAGIYGYAGKKPTSEDVVRGNIDEFVKDIKDAPEETKTTVNGAVAKIKEAVAKIKTQTDAAIAEKFPDKTETISVSDFLNGQTKEQVEAEITAADAKTEELNKAVTEAETALNEAKKAQPAETKPAEEKTETEPKADDKKVPETPKTAEETAEVKAAKVKLKDAQTALENNERYIGLRRAKLEAVKLATEEKIPKTVFEQFKLAEFETEAEPIIEEQIGKIGESLKNIHSASKAAIFLAIGAAIGAGAGLIFGGKKEHA